LLHNSDLRFARYCIILFRKALQNFTRRSGSLKKGTSIKLLFILQYYYYFYLISTVTMAFLVLSSMQTSKSISRSYRLTID